MARSLVVLVTTAVLAAGPGVAQRDAPRLADQDRIPLAEAKRLADAVQDSVWPGWGSAPFALLLVTDSLEFLVWHPRPSADFQRVGYDSLIDAEVYARPRSLPVNLLATFPAVGGVSTIVVGQPANTGKNSTEWVLTVLHEHFHQLQTSSAGYYGAVDSLRLSRGDQTGGWMLNYPFPYDSVPIQRLFAALSGSLAAALADEGTPPADGGALRRYVMARQELRAALAGDDHRYLDFQLWQEGIARYVEYACARLASGGYRPGQSFVALPDYVPYAAVASRMRADILRALHAPALGVQRRVSFYPVGAAIGLLLDRAAPRWRDSYLTRPLTLP